MKSTSSNDGPFLPAQRATVCDKIEPHAQARLALRPAEAGGGGDSVSRLRPPRSRVHALWHRLCRALLLCGARLLPFCSCSYHTHQQKQHGQARRGRRLGGSSRSARTARTASLVAPIAQRRVKHTKSTVAAALEGLSFPAPLDQCRITSAEVDGECSVNNRKGRTFLIYEFEVKLKWEGGLLDGDGLNLDSAKGTMKLGDVSAESLDDLDVEFTSKSRGSPCSEAQAAAATRRRWWRHQGAAGGGGGGRGGRRGGRRAAPRSTRRRAAGRRQGRAGAPAAAAAQGRERRRRRAAAARAPAMGAAALRRRLRRRLRTRRRRRQRSDDDDDEAPPPELARSPGSPTRPTR